MKMNRSDQITFDLTLSLLIDPSALNESEPIVVVSGFTSVVEDEPAVIARVGPDIFVPAIRFRRSASDKALAFASFFPVNSLSRD